VPVWHEATKELRRRGKVEVVAIVQDQHPDRDRLFLQWKQVDWPVLADPLNILNRETVPLTLAVDEFGIVRFTESLARAPRTTATDCDHVRRCSSSMGRGEPAQLVSARLQISRRVVAPALPDLHSSLQIDPKISALDNSESAILQGSTAHCGTRGQP